MARGGGCISCISCGVGTRAWRAFGPTLATVGTSGTRLAGYARQWTQAVLEIVNKKVGQTTFEGMPKRWIEAGKLPT